LFLGGNERYFTDDYPPEYTQIGLHGHYEGKGDLNAALVNALHLKDWIIRYSDGKADEALVERWINIPRGIGLIHFYNLALVKIGGYSTFMCQGTEPDHPRIFDCERIEKTALDLGVAASTTLVHSRDQQQIRKTILQTPPPSGFAAISECETARHQRSRPAGISPLPRRAFTAGLRALAFRPRLGLEFVACSRRCLALSPAAPHALESSASSMPSTTPSFGWVRLSSGGPPDSGSKRRAEKHSAFRLQTKHCRLALCVIKPLCRPAGCIPKVLGERDEGNCRGAMKAKAECATLFRPTLAEIP
jgi:hypothetical protein